MYIGILIPDCEVEETYVLGIGKDDCIVMYELQIAKLAVRLWKGSIELPEGHMSQ